MIEKLKRAERALLLKELAPNLTAVAIEKTIDVLVRMRLAGDVIFNGQTDRWSLTEKVLHVERRVDAACTDGRER